MLELLVLLAVLALDQASKFVCARWLTTLPHNTYPLFEGVLHLTYVENTGIAFSMLQNARWFLVAVTVCACAAIIVFYVKERKGMHKMMRISLALILAGAIGNNLIDRVLFGYVRDMIYVALIDFAIFNVADSAICIGGAMLALDLIFFKGKKYLDKLENADKKAKRKESRTPQEAADAGEDGAGEE